VRKATVISFAAVLLGALAFAFAAAGGGERRSVDISRTAAAPSVHYKLAITVLKAQGPMTLHIAGAAARDKLVAYLALGPQAAAVMRDPNFVYEGKPGGVVILGSVHWLRLRVDQMPRASQVFSTLRALTPMPLLHVVGEAKLRRVDDRGVFAGPVAYDDPIVRVALGQLTGGFEFRGLRVRIVVGRDGLIHHFLLTGRTADGTTSLALRARLFDFGEPVRVHPPKPGTFMDPVLQNLQA
jgi:hypothetical protein